MDDVYAINVAKTEFREAYNTGNAERLLAILDSGLIDLSSGRCSGYGEGGKTALRSYLQDLFAKFDAHMVLSSSRLRSWVKWQWTTVGMS
jgi:hypothetical protein